MLWIPITVAATGLQVARNALQRGLLAEGAEPLGASLVRFLPWSAVLAAVLSTSPWRFRQMHIHSVSSGFFLAYAIGGGAQILATASMLVSLRRSSFALGTVVQQSSIPLAALFRSHPGRASRTTEMGSDLALATGGLMWLGWPRGQRARLERRRARPTGRRAGFAVAGGAFRQAALSLDRGDPLLTAQLTVFVVQAMQSGVLITWLSL